MPRDQARCYTLQTLEAKISVVCSLQAVSLCRSRALSCQPRPSPCQKQEAPRGPPLSCGFRAGSSSQDHKGPRQAPTQPKCTNRQARTGRQAGKRTNRQAGRRERQVQKEHVLGTVPERPSQRADGCRGASEPGTQRPTKANQATGAPPHPEPTSGESPSGDSWDSSSHRARCDTRLCCASRCQVLKARDASKTAVHTDLHLPLPGGLGLLLCVGWTLGD